MVAAAPERKVCPALGGQFFVASAPASDPSGGGDTHLATAMAGLAWALDTVALRATGAAQIAEKEATEAILMLQCRVDVE